MRPKSRQLKKKPSPLHKSDAEDIEEFLEEGLNQSSSTSSVRWLPFQKRWRYCIWLQLASRPRLLARLYLGGFFDYVPCLGSLKAKNIDD